MSNAQYGMVIDLRSCTGCHTCVISCKTSNEVPGDGFWSHVVNYYGGELDIPVDGPKIDLKYRSTLCNHCANPACVSNCPTGAMHKDEETGVVSVDQSICIGCATCANACPYGAPSLMEEKAVMGKCNLCAGRLAEDKLPFCVQACPTRIRHVGLISDPESDVSKLIAASNAQVYLPDEGTEPSVYYILPE